MKRINSIALIIAGSCLLMAFTTISRKYRASTKLLELEIKPVEIVTIVPELDIIEVALPENRYVDFLDAIGGKESGNNYSIVNSYGYMGRYQFGASTLKGLGYDVSEEEFLNSPALQEEAMLKLLKHNKKKLKKYINKYEGRIVHGVYITESGILAAAHLGGQGNVKKFFRKGIEFKDGYGTTITSYMEKFSGYKLDLN